MDIRDRIKELRRFRAGDLKPSPRNWRTHSKHQADALRAILAEVGYVGALMARELEDGSLMLIDGHLRAETTPDAEVPVLVVDLDEAEADKVLATFDPLAALAEPDHAKLAELHERIETESPALQEMLAKLTQRPAEKDQARGGDAAAPALNETWSVVVSCDSEDAQRELYERMKAEGHQCRLLVL